MRQNAKLNLGIVRIQKYISLFRNKYLTDQSSKLHSYRDILKIRLCAANPSCCCNCLVKSRMNPAVLCDLTNKPVCISRFQFRKLTVLQNILYNGILRCKLFQNICRCGITCLCFLSTLKAKLFKQDHSHLFRRIDIKLFPCLLPDLLLQFSNTYT